ncbi:MAG: glucokinase [Succinivibrionaceae bacterium]
MSEFALVGDVGGTNARLALCNLEDGSISNTLVYSATDNPSLEGVIKQFMNANKDIAFRYACIAIACPITGDLVEMTNNPWSFSIQEMKVNLGLERLDVINDFTGQSMAIPALKSDDYVKFGGGEPVKGKPVAIYGAGTGLGVGHLFNFKDHWYSVPGEGGHVDFAPNSAEEDDLLAILREELGHVSCERLLSGMGLVNIYRAIVLSDKRIPEDLEPKDVTARALQEVPDTDCHRALNLFCVMMGRFGGDLALNIGAFGGVYIAGGIVPRFLDFFMKSGFRVAFEDKGRFKNYLSNIPVYIVTQSYAGLIGAGAYLRQELGYKI